MRRCCFVLMSVIVCSLRTAGHEARSHPHPRAAFRPRFDAGDAMTCSHEQHNILRADPERMRAECKFLAVSDGDGWDLLELYNCPHCLSTLAIKGIGPEKEETP